MDGASSGPVPRAGVPREFAPDGRRLREATTRQAVTKDTPPSWWVGASREQLNQRAADRQAAMRSAASKLKIPFRMLQ